jgi:hypothetical protein
LTLAHYLLSEFQAQMMVVDVKFQRAGDYFVVSFKEL